MSKPDLTTLFQRTFGHEVNRTRTSADADRTMPMLAASMTGPERSCSITGRDHGTRERTYLLIDISGSMMGRYQGARSKIEAAGLAAQAFIVEKARIDPGDEVGLITYNRHASVVVDAVDLVSGKAALLSAVRSLTPSGNTNIRRAFELAGQHLAPQPGVTSRIVLLTDGLDDGFVPTAESLKAKGVLIDCIGIGESSAEVNEAMLKRAASVAEGRLRYEFAKDMRQLTATFTAIGAKSMVVT